MFKPVLFEEEQISGKPYRLCYLHLKPTQRELSDDALELVGGVFKALVPESVPEDAVAQVAIFQLRERMSLPGLECLDIHASASDSRLAPMLDTSEAVAQDVLESRGVVTYRCDH